ncbi:hypothetical protein KC353_g3080 [Hortaea werneckii]|nr:hypothetical protein KC353_g3080 [Hortaea werneckii]
MNENLVERFRAQGRNPYVGRQEVQFCALLQQLNTGIREYFADAAKTVSKSAWISRPEVPTSAAQGRNSYVGRQEVQFFAMPQQLNDSIREYFADAAKTVSKSAWTSRPEVPTSAEVLDEEGGNSSSTSDIIEIVPRVLCECCKDCV